MNCSGNVIVPELISDDTCKGCFVNPDCVIINQNIPLLNIVSGMTLTDFINAVVLKLEENGEV